MKAVIELEPDAIAVKVSDGTRLKIEFATRETKIFDMSELFDLPVYQQWKRQSVFGKAHIRHGVVCWDDMVDLAPETAYFLSKSI